MQIRGKSVYREAGVGEKQSRFFFLFPCNVKMVGEEIIKAGMEGEGGKKQRREKRREDQCIYTIHL